MLAVARSSASRSLARRGLSSTVPKCDNDSKTLYVGNIPKGKPEDTRETLANLFGKFGKIEQLKYSMVGKRQHKSPPFGQVVYENAAAAASAIAASQTTPFVLEENRLRVEIAMPIPDPTPQPTLFLKRFTGTVADLRNIFTGEYAIAKFYKVGTDSVVNPDAWKLGFKTTEKATQVLEHYAGKAVTTPSWSGALDLSYASAPRTAPRAADAK